MTSERQRAANKRNAARSTGPQTASGKSRARQNATRHGLSAKVLADPARSAEVERLAKLIAADNGVSLHLARIIAEAESAIFRVRAVRVSQIDLAAASVAANKTGDQADSADGAIAFSSALPSMLKLDRYERRALSRRNKAIRALGIS